MRDKTSLNLMDFKTSFLFDFVYGNPAIEHDFIVDYGAISAAT